MKKHEVLSWDDVAESSPVDDEALDAEDGTFKYEDIGSEAEDVAPATEIPPRPDEQTREWQEDQERELGRLKVEDRKLDYAQRKRFARWLFWVMCLWLVGVFALLIWEGFAWRHFDLADNVLVALLGTTMVNVIGLFVLVARYIFPRR